MGTDISRIIKSEYFEWLIDQVGRSRKYRNLLTELHNREFTYIIDMDYNRADDGIQLRRQFGLYSNYDRELRYLEGPCSVLEMLVALAIRCEDQLMYDESCGDRTGYWFWLMIENLNLRAMNDKHYSVPFTRRVISVFLNREYEFDGTGGLFIIPNPRQDLRDVEIWYQLNWYLKYIEEREGQQC